MMSLWRRWRWVLLTILLSVGLFCPGALAMPSSSRDTCHGRESARPEQPLPCNPEQAAEAHSDMQVIHQLFVHRQQIQRQVQDTPGGIRAVTESDDPQVTAWIQDHVSRMYARLDEGNRSFTRRPTISRLFDHRDRYQRQLELTERGVIVTETAVDADMIDLIRIHAQEVNQFLAGRWPGRSFQRRRSAP